MIVRKLISASAVPPVSRSASAVHPGDRPKARPASAVPPGARSTSAVHPGDRNKAYLGKRGAPGSSFGRAEAPGDRQKSLSRQARCTREIVNKLISTSAVHPGGRQISFSRQSRSTRYIVRSRGHKPGSEEGRARSPYRGSIESRSGPDRAATECPIEPRSEAGSSRDRVPRKTRREKRTEGLRGQKRNSRARSKRGRSSNGRALVSHTRGTGIDARRLQ
jgi:hypothetical protein